MSLPSPAPKRQRMSMWLKSLVWLAAALIAGYAGGQGGATLVGAPFYFGFLVSFVLVGLAGLFALAVHAAQPPE